MEGSPSSGDALDETVLRYLRAFGPATTADIRTWSWLSGIRAAVARLRPRLRSYRDETGRELLDVEDGVFAEPDRPAPVRFLGEYDNVFLSHADRSRITGDGAWGVAYARRGALFVDGFLAGAWRLRQAPGGVTLEIEPKTPLSETARTEVAVEAEALLHLLAPDAAAAKIEFVVA